MRHGRPTQKRRPATPAEVQRMFRQLEEMTGRPTPEALKVPPPGKRKAAK